MLQLFLHGFPTLKLLMQTLHPLPMMSIRGLTVTLIYTYFGAQRPQIYTVVGIGFTASKRLVQNVPERLLRF